MKYYIIAGEASGDLHGSNLITEIHRLDADALIRCWGGDKMQAAGATLVKHYKDLAFMGFAEVVRNLPTIFRNLRYCKEDITAFRPDVVIFIDYPGFNMRIAKWARQHHYRTVFYISPQIWAWKESRVKQIKQNIDSMIVILPFEKEFYKKWDYPVAYVGHPLADVVSQYRMQHPSYHPIPHTVALLPGSRQQEIKTKLPIMLKATESFPGYRFLLAKAPSIDEDFYRPFLENYANVELVADNTYAVLMQSEAAVVTSGTATLETALFGVPEIVCYKAGNISYQIAKRLVKLQYICLVNIIMNKEVVKELIQHDLTPQKITEALSAVLTQPQKRQAIQEDYEKLRRLLSEKGNASQNAARIIYDLVKEKKGTGA